MSTAWRDRITGFVVFLLCMVGWLAIGSFPKGAALFPRLIFLIGALLSMMLLIGTFYAATKSEEEKPFIENRRRLFAAVLSTAVYIALIDRIGYFTSTTMYMLVLSWLLGFRRHLTAVTGTLGFVLFVYLAFALLFRRPLPPEWFQLH